MNRTTRTTTTSTRSATMAPWGSASFLALSCRDVAGGSIPSERDRSSDNLPVGGAIGLLAFALSLGVDFHLKLPALALLVAICSAETVRAGWSGSLMPSGGSEFFAADGRGACRECCPRCARRIYQSAVIAPKPCVRKRAPRSTFWRRDDEGGGRTNSAEHRRVHAASGQRRSIEPTPRLGPMPPMSHRYSLDRIRRKRGLLADRRRRRAAGDRVERPWSRSIGGGSGSRSTCKGDGSRPAPPLPEEFNSPPNPGSAGTTTLSPQFAAGDACTSIGIGCDLLAP